MKIARHFRFIEVMGHPPPPPLVVGSIGRGCTKAEVGPDGGGKPSVEEDATGRGKDRGLWA